MTNCPNLDRSDEDVEGSCLVIYQLCGARLLPTPRECNACTRCDPSQTINEHTKAIASEILVQNNRPPLYNGNGPGTRLKNLIAWFVETTPDCDCEHRSKIMDAWGIEGCRINKKTIIGWLVEAAMIQDIAITRMAIDGLIESVLFTSLLLDSQVPTTPRK